MQTVVDEIIRFAIGLIIGFVATVGIGGLLIYLKYCKKADYSFLLAFEDEDLKL